MADDDARSSVPRSDEEDDDAGSAASFRMKPEGWSTLMQELSDDIPVVASPNSSPAPSPCGPARARTISLGHASDVHAELAGTLPIGAPCPGTPVSQSTQGLGALKRVRTDTARTDTGTVRVPRADTSFGDEQGRQKSLRFALQVSHGVTDGTEGPGSPAAAGAPASEHTDADELPSPRSVGGGSQWSGRDALELSCYSMMQSGNSMTRALAHAAASAAQETKYGRCVAKACFKFKTLLLRRQRRRAAVTRSRVFEEDRKQTEVTSVLGDLRDDATRSVQLLRAATMRRRASCVPSSASMGPGSTFGTLRGHQLRLSELRVDSPPGKDLSATAGQAADLTPTPEQPQEEIVEDEEQAPEITTLEDALDKISQLEERVDDLMANLMAREEQLVSVAELGQQAHYKYEQRGEEVRCLAEELEHALLDKQEAERERSDLARRLRSAQDEVRQLQGAQLFLSNVQKENEQLLQQLEEREQTIARLEGDRAETRNIQWVTKKVLDKMKTHEREVKKANEDLENKERQIREDAEKAAASRAQAKIDNLHKMQRTAVAALKQAREQAERTREMKEREQQQRLAHLEAELESARARSEASAGEVQRLCARVTELQQELLETESKQGLLLAAAKSQAQQELTKERDRTTAQTRKLQSDMRRLEAELRQAAEHADQRAVEVDRLENRNEGLQEEVAGLRNALAESEDRLQQYMREAHENEERHSQEARGYLAQLQHARKDAHALGLAKEQLTEQLHELQQEHSDYEGLRDQVAELMASSKEAEARAQLFRRELDLARQALEESNAKSAKQMKAAAEAAQGREQELREALQQARAEQQHTAGRLCTLEARAENSAEGLRQRERDVIRLQGDLERAEKQMHIDRERFEKELRAAQAELSGERMHAQAALAEVQGQLADARREAAQAAAEAAQRMRQHRSDSTVREDSFNSALLEARRRIDDEMARVQRARTDLIEASQAAEIRERALREDKKRACEQLRCEMREQQQAELQTLRAQFESRLRAAQERPQGAAQRSASPGQGNGDSVAAAARRWRELVDSAREEGLRAARLAEDSARRAAAELLEAERRSEASIQCEREKVVQLQLQLGQSQGLRELFSAEQLARRRAEHMEQESAMLHVEGHLAALQSARGELEREVGGLREDLREVRAELEETAAAARLEREQAAGAAGELQRELRSAVADAKHGVAEADRLREALRELQESRLQEAAATRAAQQAERAERERRHADAAAAELAELRERLAAASAEGEAVRRRWAEGEVEVAQLAEETRAAGKRSRLAADAALQALEVAAASQEAAARSDASAREAARLLGAERRASLRRLALDERSASRAAVAASASSGEVCSAVSSPPPPPARREQLWASPRGAEC